VTDKLGIEIARGKVQFNVNPDLAVATGGGTRACVVEASLSYRNLEGATNIAADDPANIMYWTWELIYSTDTAKVMMAIKRDQTEDIVETGSGRGVVAVSTQLFLNIRFAESEADCWAASTGVFEMRLLYRFTKVTDKELRSLLANAVALQ